MPDAPYNPEIVRLLRDPEARAQFREQLRTSTPDSDGNRKIEIKTKDGKVIRTLKVLGAPS